MQEISGQPLPPRLTLAWAALAVAVIFVPITWQTWRQFPAGHGTGLRLAAAVALAALFVALPALGGWRMMRQRVYVSDDSVSQVSGGTVVRSLDFARLSEVQPVVEGSISAVTPELWGKAIVLLGEDPSGRRLGIKVSGSTVQTLDPLVRALAPVVAQRPELLRTDLSRDLFAEYLTDAR